jgi:hypothetical protein
VVGRTLPPLSCGESALRWNARLLYRVVILLFASVL